MAKPRQTAFRIAAVLFGLTLVVGFEASCRLFGWGLATDTDDPFVGFEAVVPLFVENELNQTMEIAKGRLRFFAPESFARVKPENTFRIFCLGGSTVQGRPFSVETSFTTWLQQSLTAADSSRDWDVINCGGVSYASYRLVPILQECLEYEPDLVIVCTGHNEFLEDRTYSSMKSPGSLQRILGHSRLFTLMRAAAKPNRSELEKFLLSADVDARLDYDDGLQFYKRDDNWWTLVASHFENNLRRMVESCEQAQVPVLIMLPPSNLADSPPFKTHPNAAVADEVSAAMAAARELYREDLSGAIDRLEAAIRLDERNAANRFELGRALESAGRTEAARRAFVRARDEDVCPLRMTTSLENRMRKVVEEKQTPFINLHRFLESKSKKPILGNGLLVDHIHPSFKGHQLIADELVKRLQAAGFVSPAPDWKRRAAEMHRNHFRSLDSIYFLRGQRTLDNLKRWARGRGHNLPEKPHSSEQAQ